MAGPDVFSALDPAVQVNLTIPAGATGSTLTVTTAGGSVSLNLADIGSISSIAAVAASASPADAALRSANTRQIITVAGSGLSAATRIRFTAFSSNSPQNGLYEVEVAPVAGSVAADGSSLQVSVPDDAGTGPVRLSIRPVGLILQIVPTVADIDATASTYGGGDNLRIAGGGFTEGDFSVLLGSMQVKDSWNSQGPDAFNNFCTPGSCPGRFNAGLDVQLPNDPSTGPVRVQTLGGTSAPFNISFAGYAPGTVAARGAPTDVALPSANVRQTITLLGSSFDAQTEIIFLTVCGNCSNADVGGTKVVAPVAGSVAADGTSLQVVVPDDARTGVVRIVGAEDGFFLQIVPTIVQVITPASFATDQTVTFQGSGYIEDDTVITLGTTVVLDTGAFFGPDAHNANITLSGFNRDDNDGLNVRIPPGAVAGPWEIRTSGGRARFGVVIDLGTVIYETRPDRTVAPGEQELFKARAAVEGWLDFEVHFDTSTSDVTVLNEDGTDATLIEYSNTGTDVHMRVATAQSQLFYLRTAGSSTVAFYDLTVINHDRFDDPFGPQQGSFSNSNYGSDPDGPNNAVAVSTDIKPASYASEPRLTIPVGDTDWYTLARPGHRRDGCPYPLHAGRRHTPVPRLCGLRRRWGLERRRVGCTGRRERSGR
jgi:hypothetical protein